MSVTVQIGDHVLAAYKTGEYFGEVVELSTIKAAVKVLGVLKHPTQGDLHNPQQADVAFFHQRRALAYQEIALMPYNSLEIYLKTIPDYTESLKQALEADKQELEHTIRFANKCLVELENLAKEYFYK